MSIKTSKVVTMCIVDKWENGSMFGARPVSMRASSTGNVLTIYNGDAVSFLADIDDINTGSRTRYFEGNVIGVSVFRDAVMACQ